MKKFIIFFIYVFRTGLADCQTVISTCTAPTQVVNAYGRDAAKLAVARIYKINSGYKDSVLIDKLIYNKYLDALLAVYSSTALPAWDTVVDILKIHALRSYGSTNEVIISADSNLSWIQNIRYNVYPVGNAAIENLLTKYHLVKASYFTYPNSVQANIILKSDTGYNIKALVQKFNGIPGVNAIQPVPCTAICQGSDIKDSMGVNSVNLVFSIHWGDCPVGCTNNRYWKFRVYDDCSVQYLGHGGTPIHALLAGVPKGLSDQSMELFPNPANDHFYIKHTNLSVNGAMMQISNNLGEIVYLQECNDLNRRIEIGSLNPGIYFVKIYTAVNQRTFKIVKE